MTSLLNRPRPIAAHRVPTGRRRALVVTAVVLVLALAASATALIVGRDVRGADLHREYLGADGWPTRGQAAYRAGGITRSGGDAAPVPIASLAKVMTAYLVLQAMPLTRGSDGPVLTVSVADVRDYEQRRDDDQSVVAVRYGERLTERQALLATLLPSANNVALMLARHAAGSRAEFVARMNAEARTLGMARTRYTDPSGFDPGTVSTARDQLTLAAALARDGALGDTFGDLVATGSVRLPVAGVVHTTDTLLGQDGFVGTKTGSDDAAGGCFMFRTYRVIGGRVTDVLGVVLGQHGRHDITAGQQAARQVADRLGPAAGA